MNYLLLNNHPIKEWYYGHFHYYKLQYINDIKFVLLDIEQFQEIY